MEDTHPAIPPGPQRRQIHIDVALARVTLASLRGGYDPELTRHEKAQSPWA